MVNKQAGVMTTSLDELRKKHRQEIKQAIADIRAANRERNKVSQRPANAWSGDGEQVSQRPANAWSGDGEQVSQRLAHARSEDGEQVGRRRVDNRIKIPSRISSPILIILQKMKVGGSYLFDHIPKGARSDKNPVRPGGMIYRIAPYMTREARRSGKKFTARTLPDGRGVRVWRTA